MMERIPRDQVLDEFRSNEQVIDVESIPENLLEE